MANSIASPLIGIMRLGLIEWWRTRWPWLLILCVTTGVALGLFAESLAVTESVEIRLTLQAASTRLLVITAFSLLLIVNSVRDANDGLLEFMLARPIARWHWWLGKFLACAWVAVMSALFAALPLLAGAVPLAVISWACSLACELLVMAAVALTLALGQRQVTSAFAAAMGLYLLCRALQSLVLLSRDTLLDSGTLMQSSLAATFRGLALLLPDLGRYTQSEWLVGTPPGAEEIGFILLQTALGTAIFALIGIIDFNARRD